MFDTDKYGLSLVCGLCYEPQETSVYPIPIEKPSEHTQYVAAKLLPIATATLQVGNIVNGIGGIGRMLGCASGGVTRAF